jgi:hypothetical protein
MHAWLALVQALQRQPTWPLPGVRGGDAAAGTFADGHYTRRYAIRPSPPSGEGTSLVPKTMPRPGGGARCPAVQSLLLRVRAGGVFMGRTARERLARLLDDAEAPGSFSAQILAPADALRVEVVGAGGRADSVPGALAKKLIAVGIYDQRLPTRTVLRFDCSVAQGAILRNGP